MKMKMKMRKRKNEGRARATEVQEHEEQKEHEEAITQSESKEEAPPVFEIMTIQSKKKINPRKRTFQQLSPSPRTKRRSSYRPSPCQPLAESPTKRARITNNHNVNCNVNNHSQVSYIFIIAQELFFSLMLNVGNGCNISIVIVFSRAKYEGIIHFCV